MTSTKVRLRARFCHTSDVTFSYGPNKATAWSGFRLRNRTWVVGRSTAPYRDSGREIRHPSCCRRHLCRIPLLKTFPTDESARVVGGNIGCASLARGRLCSFALLNQSYITAPRPQAVASFAGRDELWLKWRFLGNLHLAVDWNRRKLDRKIRFLTAAQALLIATVGLNGGYFVLTTLRGGQTLAIRKSEHEQTPTPVLQVPAPIGDGYDYVQSLGCVIDDLMGHSRDGEKVGALRSENRPGDPDPTTPPEPVPKATASVPRTQFPKPSRPSSAFFGALYSRPRGPPVTWSLVPRMSLRGRVMV